MGESQEIPEILSSNVGSPVISLSELSISDRGSAHKGFKNKTFRLFHKKKNDAIKCLLVGPSNSGKI
ncbi:hypothetical protein HMI55_006047 [Coelomomyces lativittatus]|nr:hypothetical protein HMI55_006047 [Coelomomyces lativittatus]KAJ1510807.1 hypothetical protein HMI56_006164 [Coelomomyces lativittatus]